MPPAPRGELPTVMAFVKYECVEMMADGGLGLGESGVRGGVLKIGQRHSSHGIAAQAPRSCKPLDEG